MVRADRIPPTVLVLVAVTSVQVGAALAKSLFDEVGPGGIVFLRVLFAAVVLVAVWRPAVAGRPRADWRLIAVFGLCLGAMNLAFYESIERIPLGVAVTFEFVGPLGVAIAGSRRPLDLAWVLMAAAGIVLLSDFGTADLDGLGVALALVAGALWAAYILLSARVGQVFPDGSGLALAMVVAAAALVPVGVADAGGDLLAPRSPSPGGRRGDPVLGDSLHARDGGAAAHAGGRVRGDDEHRAGSGGPRRLHRARRGPSHPRAGRNPARGGRQCRGGTTWARAAAGRVTCLGKRGGHVLLRLSRVSRDGGPDGE